MRLKKLQVSGFKSFVDVTDIRLPADLVAVVGPNGCGKSNVIDAVRWVMGETSAKMLRGDNMADVIFNGSSARKPVGKASVELIFDNSDGSAGGNYAAFAEISIKRTLSRDGQSSYFINRIKTRRKDVLDLFRGTGLGPRSYSIIEQGMVSRIIEARPEDLRVFVEEAAGTSRYKDRRRETETRIRHTHENLDRVADIRDELDKQLRRLKRQASAARRYKVLKEEEHLVNGQWQTLRLQAMNRQLEEQDRLSAQHDNALEAALAGQREIESTIEKLRQQQGEAQEEHNKVQQEYYALGAEISNIEQRIEHLVETRQQQEAERARLESSNVAGTEKLAQDEERLKHLNTELLRIAPMLDQLTAWKLEADERLADAELNVQQWQERWQAFNEESQAPAREQEVQQSRIGQLEQHMQRSAERKERLEKELGETLEQIESMNIDALRAEVQQHDARCEAREKAFHDTESSLQATQATLQAKREEMSDLRAREHETKSRLESLEQIQKAALGGDNEALQGWIERNGLTDSPRLATRMQVADGWERATDRLMNGHLGAVCVTQLPESLREERPDGAVTVVTQQAVERTRSDDERPRLLDKVSGGDTDLSPFLGGVFLAESLGQAISMQSLLHDREVVVTRDGTLVGANWVSYASEDQLETGVLVREEEIHRLRDTARELEQGFAALEQEVARLDEERVQIQQKLVTQRSELNQLRLERTAGHSRLSRDETRHQQAGEQADRLRQEIGSLGGHVDSDHREISKARDLLKQATEHRDTMDTRRDELLEERDEVQRALSLRREELREINDKHHDFALNKQRLDAEQDSTRDSIRRLEEQFQLTSSRIAQIDAARGNAGDPEAELRSSLEGMLEKRVSAEQRFSAASDRVADIDNRIIEANDGRSSSINAVNEAREALDAQKMARQEVVVRRSTHVEQMVAQDFDAEALASDMPEEAEVDLWQEKLADLERKINRIGPVNLVAIEEFDEESERKEYLDRQHADLTEALETLQSVIRKIDRETRSRFRETFEALNAGFQDFFPKLFGGGTAELQLNSDDLLTAGVTVMARPPGKRNSHIHLLSGGEKALTAVALLFALFKLHPAPFCMLDEVDAPLDDANVDRYCRTLRSLSELSQMIVITHNKITMESADVLVGVTMAEAGVSRLVSVDLDEAVEMAAQG